MRLITALWIIFAGLFLVLAIFHWHAALQTIPQFEAKPSPGVGAIEGIPIAKSGFKKFIAEFNSFIDQQNALTRRQNTVAAVGYLFAFITAILSAFLTIESCSQRLNNLRLADIMQYFQRKRSDNKPDAPDRNNMRGLS